MNDRNSLLDARGGPADRLRDADRIERLGKRAAIFGEVDRLDARAHDLYTEGVERLGQVDRSLASELNERAVHMLSLGYVECAIQVERVEVQAIRGVEIRRDSLRV